MRKAGRPLAAWSRTFTPRPCCARPNTRERKSKLSQIIKDAADLFAAEGEEASEILEELKEQAQDALGLAVSEAPPKGNTLGQYRFFKETELPLLMRLEDPGERRAALHDIANEHNLGLKNLQSALTIAEKQAQEAAKARAAEEHEGEDAGDEALV